MHVDLEAARAAFEPLASTMGFSIEEAARGVIHIANDHMAKALRVISVQRGLDPAQYTLTCFGGAGGLHVCELAEALGMNRALVPIHAGVLSALGMLVAPASRQLSHSYLRNLAECSQKDIEHKLAELIRTGESELHQEGVRDIENRLSLDLRYEGQSSTLQVPWSNIETCIEAFHAAHEKRYGHRMEIPVEVVTLRAGLEATHAPPELPRRPDMRTAEPYAKGVVSGIETSVPIYHREELAPGQMLEGPALITEKVSTTFIAPGWQCLADAYGNLSLTSSP
jgi:N-methylhydantoinase A